MNPTNETPKDLPIIPETLDHLGEWLAFKMGYWGETGRGSKEAADICETVKECVQKLLDRAASQSPASPSFEEWAVSQNLCLHVHPPQEGDAKRYFDGFTRWASRAWFAATALHDARIRELEAVITKLDRFLGYVGVELAGTHHSHISDKTLELHREAQALSQPEAKKDEPPVKWAKEREAFAQGKRIQNRKIDEGFRDFTGRNPNFDSPMFIWRIHPDDDNPTSPAPEAWVPKFSVGQKVIVLADRNISEIKAHRDGWYKISDGRWFSDAVLKPYVWRLTNHLPGFRPLAEGESWHRTDGWTEEMLPTGWRPLLNGEEYQLGDQWGWPGQTWYNVGPSTERGRATSDSMHSRTRRDLPSPPTSQGDACPTCGSKNTRVSFLLPKGAINKYCDHPFHDSTPQPPAVEWPTVLDSESVFSHAPKGNNPHQSFKFGIQAVHDNLISHATTLLAEQAKRLDEIQKAHAKHLDGREALTREVEKHRDQCAAELETERTAHAETKRQLKETLETLLVTVKQRNNAIEKHQQAESQLQMAMDGMVGGVDELEKKLSAATARAEKAENERDHNRICVDRLTVERDSEKSRADKAEKERDMFDARLGGTQQANEVCKLEISRLRADLAQAKQGSSGWIATSERKPTRGDADQDGKVEAVGKFGSRDLFSWSAAGFYLPKEDNYYFPFWRPFASPLPQPEEPFEKWFQTTDIALNSEHEPIYKTIARRAWLAAKGGKAS